MKLYQRLADDISTLIRDGTLRLGERIPSVREISRERSLSTATVVRAYEVLEAQGLIETRPRSGFYVSGQWHAGRGSDGPVAASSKPSASAAASALAPTRSSWRTATGLKADRVRWQSCFRR